MRRASCRRDVEMLRTLNERLRTFRAVLIPAGGRYELRDQQTGHVIAANIDLATSAETNPRLIQREHETGATAL